mmetsp:Transcript_4592/g.12981  ORF Transcript_4592/g.12981 Transcript_4592/m.12981 type:complete len:393 (+) Transcript_4592:475-1653(+)|eukprot:CAMPEP_0181040260 /NCGR_PEP_ID=MMETSP1070-20121207/10948_1 /TAXON_ID=265543 /ORGANISM="Minutocellus polymorphus, Strain NH13" /LENGTH=392 /DNA_ID=CAMNT_0023118247 /DNA_START=383 /DNA_END=1561 /DNA_ORIENTATION=+
MSAYATSFFLPPTSSIGGCQKDTKCGVHNTSCAEDSVPASLPRHLSDDEKPLTTSPPCSENTKICMRKRVPDILISVKSASVDPAGFVRAITGRGGDGRKRPLPRGPRPASNDKAKCVETSSNIDHPLPPIRPKSRKPTPKQSDGNGPEEAIKFELSISYAGRKYSATRTLNRLVRLRQDLTREIEERRPGIVVPKRNGDHNDDDTAVTASNSFDSDHSPRNDSSSDTSPPPVVMIPELPVAGSDASDDGSAGHPHKDHRGLPTSATKIKGGNGGSLVSGSFTLLHMALVQYCPAVENWFHRILTDILPDPESSPSLIAFLWEPLGALGGEGDEGSTKDIAAAVPAFGRQGKIGMGSKRHSSTRSICTLGSINEKNNGGDDEEEDEEEGNAE